MKIMKPNEKLILIKALAQLCCAVNSGRELCCLLVDSRDGRIEDMTDALGKANDAILELNEAFGIEGRKP